MDSNSQNLDITVLIATYNRMEDLEQTLEAMCVVKRDNLAVEFVVIDNNSKDNTKEVVESFSNKLPLRYLFQPRPGKSCALNKALDEVKLGDIVVFTDDDVTPRPDWLKQIIASCRRNPEHAIGGGKVITVWPDNRDPHWLPFCKTTCGLRGHDIGHEESLYPDDSCPTGSNFWIRKHLFEKGLRFDESIGPSPVKSAMGEETYLLSRLRQDGHKIVYCPDSVIHHRLQESLSASNGIRHRAYTMGRGSAVISILRHPELQRNNPLLYRLSRVGALGFAGLRLLVACMSFSPARRVGQSIEPIADIAYNIEILKSSCSDRK